MTSEQVDQKAAAAAVDPAQVTNMDSFDALTFSDTTGTRGLTLTTIDFAMESSATDHVGLLLSDPSLQPLSPPIGETSAGVGINASGFGSMIVFKKGEWAVVLHTTQPDGTAPPVTMEGLQELAVLVAGRL